MAMRVTIASRIFSPEPSAATFRLTALAKELAAAGHSVEVLTVKPPARLATLCEDQLRSYRVRRFPVLRDRSGYVRGYVQYLSFDVPLFFRVLFGRKTDAIIVEPPPTTGLFVRVAAWLRRTPYIYYAADIWSDAAQLTGAPNLVLQLLGRAERWVLNGAMLVLAVSPGVQQRLGELGVRSRVSMVGNGVDIASFRFEQQPAPGERDAPLFVYAGTAAEWHGAEIFLQAMAIVQQRFATARLRFIGGGSEKTKLAALASELQLRNVEFWEPIPPAELGGWLRVATASLASVRQGSVYEFAFPTKLYSSAAAGTPLIFAGGGPAVDFVRTEVAGTPLGAAETSVAAVAEAMIRAIESPPSTERRREVAHWARQHVSLDGVAAKIRVELEQALGHEAASDGASRAS